jgi:hypothetical protein
MDTTSSLSELIEQAYEAVRAFNHRSSGGVTLPPEAYSVLGEAKPLVATLPQALHQLGAGLQRALREYDVYGHNRDPAESVAQALDRLTAAAELAQEMYAHLEAAQTAINYQGVNTDADGNLIHRPPLRSLP